MILKSNCKEAAIGHLIQLLAENRKSPKYHIPEELHNVIQEIIAKEGGQASEADYLQLLLAGLEPLIKEARHYQEKTGVNNLGHTPHMWLYHSSKRHHMSIDMTGCTIRLLVELSPRKMTAEEIESELMRLLSNEYLEEELDRRANNPDNDGTDFDNVKYPRYFAKFILQKLGFPSIATQTRRLRKRTDFDETFSQSLKTKFDMVFECIMPTSHDVREEIWGIIQKRMPEITAHAIEYGARKFTLLPDRH